MKKRTIIAALVAAVGGIYTGFWYYSAHNLKKQINEFSTTNPRLFLKHEGISCQGFPFKIEAVIKNPLLGAKTSTTLKQISTEGTWTLGTTVFQRSYCAEIEGRTRLEPSEGKSWVLAGILHGEVPRSNISKMQSASHVEWLKLVSDVEGSFRAKNLSVACEAEKQPLFEVDNWIVNCKKVKAAPGYTEARQMNIDLQGYQVDQKTLAQLMYTQQEIVSILGEIRSSGKNDLSSQMRFQYCPEKEASPFCFELEKMSYRSAFGDRGSVQGKCALNDVQSNGYKGVFSLQIKQEISRQANDYMLSNMRSLFQQKSKLGHFAAYPPLGTLFVDHWDQAVTLFPDYSSWSPIEMQIDLSFQVREKGQPEEEWKLDLKNCQFKTSAHEIVLKGSKGFADSGAVSFLELQIPHYHRFLQDLGDYYNRWLSILTSTQTVPEQEIAPLTGKAMDRITSFLGLLSESKGDDLRLVVQGSAWEDMTVGSLNTEAFSLEFQKFMADLADEMSPPAEPQVKI